MRETLLGVGERRRDLFGRGFRNLAEAVGGIGGIINQPMAATAPLPLREGLGVGG